MGRGIEERLARGLACNRILVPPGSIESGKRAALIAVRLPPDLTDVEEYLVSGVQPNQLRWLGA